MSSLIFPQSGQDFHSFCAEQGEGPGRHRVQAPRRWGGGAWREARRAGALGIPASGPQVSGSLGGGGGGGGDTVRADKEKKNGVFHKDSGEMCVRVLFAKEKKKKKRDPNVLEFYN